MSRLDVIENDDKVLYTIFNNYTATVGDIQKTINQTAFNICPSNKPSVKINETVEYKGEKYEVISLYERAFYKCKLSGISFPKTIKYIGNNAIDLCEITSEIVFPDSLLSIGHYGLSNYRGKSITIPKNVQFIGEGAFAYNSNLQTIKVDSTNKYFKIDNQSVLYDAHFKKIIQAPAKLTEITIPETVLEIKSAALSNMRINKLIIPIPVRKINPGFASFCGNLKQVYFRGNIKFAKDGDYFRNVKLDILSYFGTLPIETNFLQDDEVQQIVVCHGYLGKTVSRREFTVSEHCQSYPLDKTYCFYKKCYTFYYSLFTYILCIVNEI